MIGSSDIYNLQYSDYYDLNMFLYTVEQERCSSQSVKTLTTKYSNPDFFDSRI